MLNSKMVKEAASAAGAGAILIGEMCDNCGDFRRTAP